MLRDAGPDTPRLAGVRAAFAFLELIREDTALRAQVAGLGVAGPLEDLCALGHQSGFHFREHELRQAFALDWRMRRMHARIESDN